MTTNGLTRRLLILAAAVLLPIAANAQPVGGGLSNRSMLDATNPPFTPCRPSQGASISQYTISSGVVSISSGTFVWPSWMQYGRIRLVAGGTEFIYTVASRNSDTSITLDNTSVSSGAIELWYGADAASPNDAADDLNHLQAQADYLARLGNQAVWFLPPQDGLPQSQQGYKLSSTLRVQDIQGLKMTGGGRPVYWNRFQQPGNHGGTHITYTGGTVGPAVAFEDCDGLTLEGIQFIGDDATTGLPGNPAQLDVLVTFRNTADNAGNFFDVVIRDAMFSRAKTLLDINTNVAIGMANILYENVTFDGEHTGAARPGNEPGASTTNTMYGVRNRHNQGLIHTFVHCQWTDCNTCVRFDDGGRMQFYGCWTANCYQFVSRGTGSQNTAGVSIKDLFINNSGSMKMQIYESDAARGWGPISVEGIHHGSAYPSGVNGGNTYIPISSYVGNTIVLSASYDLRPGDKVAFFDVNNPNTRLNASTIPYIQSKIGAQQYTLSHTAAQLGVTVNANTRFTDYEPMFRLRGGEHLHVRDCWFRENIVQGQRLCELTSGSFGSNRQAVAVFDNCQGFETTAAANLPTNYLQINNVTTTNYYRFRDCSQWFPTGGSFTSPFNITNITDSGGGLSLPVDDTQTLVRDPLDTTKLVRLDAGTVGTGQTRVLAMPNSDVLLRKNNYTGTTAPAANDDSGDGYDIGSLWTDNIALKTYICQNATLGGALWKEITVASGGGLSLPVDDTQTLVRDPGDNTKVMRIDVGNVGTSTTRVLSMPNSDVTLHKSTVTTISPTANDDSADGYTVGSTWLNTSMQTAYVCMDNSAGAAVWVPTSGSGGGGFTLPVADTASIVHDVTDSSKQLRLDAGLIAASTVRSLFMPDSDVSLHKNNEAGVAAPSINDDTTLGYTVGSRWFDLVQDKEYVCLDNTDGAAVWVVSGMSAGTQPVPGDPMVPTNRIWQLIRATNTVGSKSVIAKKASEVIPVAANFNPILASTETLATIESVTVDPAIGVTASNQAIAGNYVKMTLTGGTQASNGEIKITVTTAAPHGATIEVSVPVQIIP